MAKWTTFTQNLQCDTHPVTMSCISDEALRTNLIYLYYNLFFSFCPSHILNYIINRSPFNPEDTKIMRIWFGFALWDGKIFQHHSGGHNELESPCSRSILYPWNNATLFLIITAVLLFRQIDLISMTRHT